MADMYTCADVYVADLGTAMPTALADALTGFDRVGALQDDSAFTLDGLTGDTTTHRDFCNNIVLVNHRGEEPTFAFVAIDNTALTQRLLHENVDVVTAAGETTTTWGPTKTVIERAFVVELKSVLGYTERYCFPRGAVVDRASIDHNNSDLTAYEITVGILTSNGSFGYIISDNPMAALEGVPA